MRGRALAVALALLLGCGAEQAPARYAAPATARAALVLEPPVVAVGDVAALELAVVTRPGQSVKPFELPTQVEGFWVVERLPFRVAKETSRWVHSAQLRLRAIEVGRFEFPGGSVEVAAPDGGTSVLDYEPLPLEVVSTLSDPPSRQTPYGVRTLPFEGDRGGSSAVAFAAGALLALASVGVLLLVRRRLAARDAADASPPPRPVPPWEAARARIAEARERLERDPRGSLDLASAALRAYAVGRFGGDATVRTTQELRASQPPFTMTTRWAAFVDLLADLDAARFPATPVPAKRARTLVDAVAGFVEASVPAEWRT